MIRLITYTKKDWIFPIFFQSYDELFESLSKSIGEEKADVESIKEMLEKEKNTTGYTTAPANGLYLVDITY